MKINKIKILLGLALIGMFFLFPKTSKAACGLHENTNLGAVSIAAPCTIDADSIEGVDSAQNSEASTTNDGELSITAAVTINSGVGGTTKLISGSISLGTGGSIAIGSTNVSIKIGNGVWLADGEADGWAGSWTLLDATAAAKRRLGLMRSDSTLDCNDAAYSEANTCYPAFYPAFYPGFYPSFYPSFYPGFYPGFYPSFYPSFSPTFSPGCFDKETKVLMADGTYKEIYKIKPGDRVTSYDIAKGLTTQETVVSLLIHPENSLGYLIINGNLKVTPNHGVWVASNSSWQKAETIKVGDKLLGPKGNEVEVKTIQSLPGTNTVYNLQLNGANHVFFTEGILVHNVAVKY